MKIFSSTVFSLKNCLLTLSLVSNVVLIVACVVALQKMKNIYTDYRHFRSLPIGISSASSTAIVENAVVLFGDSRVETWKPLPTLPSKIVINAGVTGETTSEMRRRFDNDVLRLKPQTVVIQAGMNDLTASNTRDIPNPQQIHDRMLKNFEYFISTLIGSGSRVILTSIIPNKNLTPLRKMFWHSDLQQSVSSSNRQLKALAEKYRAIWLDLNDIFVDADNRIHTELYKDLLHITSPAYTQINGRINKLF